MRNKITSIVLVSLIVVAQAMAQGIGTQPHRIDDLQQHFRHPSGEARPFTLWYWMYGALSTEALTADLEAMKAVGLGGAYMVHIKSPGQGPEYPNPSPQLTPEWWDKVKHVVNEADRLDLKLGLHICDGFALAGGPWISPEESMQKIVFTDTIAPGGGITRMLLRRPETNMGYYKDIAILAYPLPQGISPDAGGEKDPVITHSSEVTLSGGFYRANATDIDLQANGAWIQYEYPEPFTCRSIEIEKVTNNYQSQNLTVMASDDGVNFRLVKRLVPARQGWQDYDFNNTHAIPPTTARYFRFYWNPEGSDPGSEDMNDAKWKPNLKIGKIHLRTEPRLNQWEGKAGYVWRVSPETTASELGDLDCIRKEDIIDLTRFVTDDILTARLPKGSMWKILRIGHTTTGHTNATGGAGKGLECDKFAPEAVQKQVDNWFGAIYNSIDREVARRTLKYFYIDSWECGSQNWSKNFAAEFKARRGYDLMPYLPLLAGIPVESRERSEAVLRDVRTTIGELTTDVFYSVMAQAARKYDCEFTAESIAPVMVADGMMHYRTVDLPMGEFWYNSPTHDKLNDVLDAVHSAHIYGKNIIQAEGFTQIRGTWNEHPGMLKTMLDRNYSFGVNRLNFHVYIHNPFMDRQPGMTLDGIGFFFQRDQTWWPNGAKAFVDYAARCQALLQYGHPVVDIGVFTGEEMPRRAILPERLVPSLPGLFGTERVEREQRRLANAGLPVRRIVGVSQSANMTVAEDWVNPLRGYAYDSFNVDVLLNHATVCDGRMVLPGGASYRVVVLPLPHPMNPDDRPLSDAVSAKIEELRRGGVIIPTLPYQHEDFSGEQLERDVVVPQQIAWVHRSGPDAEIYFIANQQAEQVTFEASLRCDEGRPELWNPVTGTITAPPHWSRGNGRTVLSLELNANESVFVVFPKGDHERSVDPSQSNAGKAIPLKVKAWTVDFPAIGQRVSKKKLFDWSKEQDERIKYYSGTATYTATLDVKVDADSEQQRIYLDLGHVENVATVRINGVDCGTIWTAPHRVDVTHALKRGKNKVEIEVSNTWANALNGADNGKPPFEGIWTNGKYRREDKSLLPAGLLGPISLVVTK